MTWPSSSQWGGSLCWVMFLENLLKRKWHTPSPLPHPLHCYLRRILWKKSNFEPWETRSHSSGRDSRSPVPGTIMLLNTSPELPFCKFSLGEGVRKWGRGRKRGRERGRNFLYKPPLFGTFSCIQLNPILSDIKPYIPRDLWVQRN